MTDPNKSRHWAELAREIGADAGPEPSRGEKGKETVEEPQAQEPTTSARPSVFEKVVKAMSPKRAAKPKVVKPPTTPAPEKSHWQTLAADFGITDPILPQSDSRPSTKERSPESLAGGEEHRPSPASLDGLSPSPFLPEELFLVSENFMDEIADVETVEFAPDEAGLSDEDSSRTESSERVEDSDRKRRRRRRGRRGRKRGSRSESQTSTTNLEGESGWDDEHDETGAEEADHLLQTADSSELLDDEDEHDEIGGSPMGDGLEWDDDSDETETGERSRSKAAGSSDSTASKGGGRDNGTSKTSRDRKIPTWSDAIGVIINANLEGRRKSGSGGGPRGRRRRPGGKRK
jgi:ribonuclease E